MAETWVIADPHFGHEMVAKLRGFESAYEHDEHLLAICGRRFREGDTIWWLGDIAFAGWRDRLPATIGTLVGDHHLILGNHDRPHPLHSNGHRYAGEFLRYFDTVGLAARVSWNGKGALLSHFPYAGTDHTAESRFNEWRLPDCGRPLIHGHTHSQSTWSTSNKNTLQLCAGVEAWQGPVTLAELMKEI